MEIKDKNYITILGWMRTALHLSGNELLVYAIIYGFTQDENQWFSYGLQYLTEWIGVSNKQRTREIIARLVEKNLLVKETSVINGVTFCKYRTNSHAVAEKDTPVAEKAIGGVAERATGMAEKATNITNNITDISITDNINIPPQSPKGGDDLSFVGIEFKDAFVRFLEYRREIKKPFKSKKSIEACYRNALQLSDNDPNTFDKVIEQSIANGWQGLFALKTENNGNNTRTSGAASTRTIDGVTYGNAYSGFLKSL